MSRNRNNKTTLEQQQMPAHQQNSNWKPSLGHLEPGSIQEQVSIKRRLSANPNNEQAWSTRDAKNNSLPMSIQGMQQSQHVAPGTHRPLANAQYDIPRTRSIVVEKGRGASDSPQLINMSGVAAGKKPNMLEPMTAATANSISNTQQNLTSSIQDMSMMAAQHQNSRTQEAKKFATYSTTGKLSKAGSVNAPGDKSNVGKISRAAILQNKVTEDQGSAGGNMMSRKTRPKF